TLSSSVRAIRALTSGTSLSPDDTSSLSQSYDSVIRPLFLPEDELGAEALKIRRASLALTLLYLASKSLVCLVQVEKKAVDSRVAGTRVFTLLVP
nr:hypothetical protein [Tanacetum cinerariifolium]